MRSIGWSQDAGNLNNLKPLIQIFVHNTYMHDLLVKDKIVKCVGDKDLSDRFLSILKENVIKIKYNDIIGKGPLNGETRSNASCTGIGQLAFISQNGREYVSNWATNSFLTLAISLGLLNYDENLDECYVSELGEKYALSENNSKVELECLENALLAYPPVARILHLLHKHGEMTKFELGSNLGFVGESGFGSISQNLYVYTIINAATAKEKTEIRQNMEGMCDKYSRMIAGWLVSVGWLTSGRKNVEEFYSGKKYTLNNLKSYQITREGIKALNRAYGKSRYKKINKIVYFGFLSTKASGVDYVRARRANIIKYISNKPRTLNQINNHLISNSFSDSKECIFDDLLGFERIGLNIEHISQIGKEDRFILRDGIINLNIPNIQSEVPGILQIKDDVRKELKHISHSYLDLIDLSFDSKKNREFEIRTIELFTNELELLGAHLGGSSKPDGVVTLLNNGLVIDNKAYSQGFTLPIKQADEMVRYLEDIKSKSAKINPNRWWEIFDSNIDEYSFLFVSSCYVGNFKDKITNIFERTKIRGSVITASNLLLLAEKFKSGQITEKQLLSLFNSNDEIIIE